MNVTRHRTGAPRRAAVLAVLSALVCAGCGARVPPVGLAGTPIPAGPVQSDPVDKQPAAVSDDPGAMVTEATGPAAAPTEAAQPTATSTATAPPSPTESAPASHHNDGTVRLSVTPSCASPGGVLRVTFTGPPDADVNGVVVWPDGSSRFSDRIFGRSDANGQYVWPLAVPVDTSAGEGTILGGMTSAERYGSADIPFSIAPDC